MFNKLSAEELERMISFREFYRLEKKEPLLRNRAKALNLE